VCPHTRRTGVDWIGLAWLGLAWIDATGGCDATIERMGVSGSSARGRGDVGERTVSASAPHAARIRVRDA